MVREEFVKEVSFEERIGRSEGLSFAEIGEENPLGRRKCDHIGPKAVVCLEYFRYREKVSVVHRGRTKINHASPCRVLSFFSSEMGTH